MSKKVALVLVSLSVLLSTIAGSTIASSKPKPKPYVALLVAESGGYVMPQYNFTRLPRIVVYSDGRMFAQSDVTTLQYPGPAVQTLRVKSVGSTSKILSALYKTQLWNSKFDWGYPGVADVADTDVTSRVSSRLKPKKVSVYALSFTGPRLTKRQIKERKAATKLLDELQNFSNKYISTKSLPTPWTPERWAYQVSEAIANDFTNYQDWVGGTITGQVNCAVLTPEESAKLTALLPQINQGTQFNSGGKAWDVALRPILPHETGCSSLGYK